MVGLKAETEADLYHALFSEGISTAEETTDISGRGVGTSAVAATVRELGGTIAVHSERAKGTCFRFELPLQKNSRPRAAA